MISIINPIIFVSTVKKWTLSGDEIELFHGHDAFVFTILINNEYLFSGGDDAVVNIWKGQEKVGNCFHPNTVWDMTFSGSDLVTACGDGIIRVFSNDPSKWLPANEIQDYNNMCFQAMSKGYN